VSVTGCTGSATVCTGSLTLCSVSVTGCTGSATVCTEPVTLCSVSVTGCTESVAGSVAIVPSARPPGATSMLWVVLVAPSVVDEAVPSTDPRVSAGEVDPESVAVASLDAETGSSVVDVVGSVTVASPGEAEASTGAEAASSAEGVASVEGVASAEDEGVASAEGASSVLVFDGAGSVTTAVVGSVEEVVVSVAACEVSCVVVLAASTVVSVLTVVATGSMSTVGSLKV
jgi:hypothetical protein